MLCDPEVEIDLADWLINNVCPASGNKQSCADIVNGVAPALFEWLRLGADANELCSHAGVCGTSSMLFSAKPKARAFVPSSSNDMTCPLCMFVVSKVKEQLSDPLTRQAIHDRTTAACQMMPEGSMRDACTQWANKYEETIFNFVDKMESEELCALLGSCSLAQKLLAHPMPPLPKAAIQAFAPLSKALLLRDAIPSNDNCETCKVVVAQMHSALANPELQVEVVDYAKAACDAMGSFAQSCKDHIDQYAPMAFGMVLAYLQPEQVCRQLNMCPPPSFAAEIMSTMVGTLFPERFGGAMLLRGQPLMAHPMDALRLPRT